MVHTSFLLYFVSFYIVRRVLLHRLVFSLYVRNYYSVPYREGAGEGEDGHRGVSYTIEVIIEGFEFTVKSPFNK